MSKKQLITGVNTDGTLSSGKRAPKIVGVHPFGSKILVEVIPAEELIETSLYVPDNVSSDGAPQAYIVEVGPGITPESGLAVGQRIYWSGKGTAVSDPRASDKRVRALLEVHNIQAVIEEAQ